MMTSQSMNPHHQSLNEDPALLFYLQFGTYLLKEVHKVLNSLHKHNCLGFVVEALLVFFQIVDCLTNPEQLKNSTHSSYWVFLQKADCGTNLRISTYLISQCFEEYDHSIHSLTDLVDSIATRSTNSLGIRPVNLLFERSTLLSNPRFMS